MRYRVRHLTEYVYTDTVSLSHHVAHLSPRADNGQTSLARELRITPTPAFRRERLDGFGNRTTYFSIEEPHKRLEVEASLEIDVTVPTRPPRPPTISWEAVRDRLQSEARADIAQAYGFTFDSPYVKQSRALADYARASFADGRPLLDAALDLCKRIFAEFTYDPRATNVSTPVAEVLRARRGVCQDFSHLALGALRSLGLPARYVSGYLLTRPPPGRPRLVGADASHAWVSLYAPDYGWVDFDPTNGIMPGEEHITLACGRDFGDVAPLRGVIMGGGSHALKVAVDVSVVDPPAVDEGG